MGRYLAIDLGSTSLTAVVVESEPWSVLEVESAANRREMTSATDRRRGRSEWDLDGMVTDAIDLAHQVVQRVGDGLGFDGIGVTGQQHGCQILSADGSPTGPFLSWQDRRAGDLSSTVIGAPTYVELVAERGGAYQDGESLPRFRRTGCPLNPRHTAPLLFWLDADGALSEDARAATAPDYLVSCLTGGTHLLDSTIAHAWGVYDVFSGEWDHEVVTSLGLAESLFPPLAGSAEVAGVLDEKIATQIGLKAGTPVAVASGDHQCSFAGSVARHAESVAVNVGTAGQVSLFIDEPVEPRWLELRPFMQRGYLLAAVGRVGGRNFRYLREFISQATTFGFADMDAVVTDSSIDQDTLYQRLVAAAGAAGQDAGGVRCVPLFEGTPDNTGKRAYFEGLTATNFTPGNLTRALLNGIVRELHEGYNQAVDLGAGARTTLVGSGNGLRLNPVLREEMARQFGLPLVSGTFIEEAAVGAALCASVSVGEYLTVQEASETLFGYTTAADQVK